MSTSRPASPPPPLAAPPAGFSWSFRYEGPPSGLAAALDAGVPKDPGAQVQYGIVKELLLTESASPSALLRVVARGDAGLEDGAARNLVVDVITVR
jgi:hypothetical protein